jgi:hypothetical protein
MTLEQDVIGDNVILGVDQWANQTFTHFSVISGNLPLFLLFGVAC